MKDEDKEMDESSILMAKGSIKYLIDCDLAEIVEKVVDLGQRASDIYNRNAQSGERDDLYLAINEFVRETHRQTQKHREIGRELIAFVSAS